MSGMVLSLVEAAGGAVREDVGVAGADDLRRIIHKAILARRFAAIHKQTVRQCLRAARVAANGRDSELAAALLKDARAEHAEVQTCTRVARTLERQAEELGRAAGVYRATGRGSASTPSDEIAPMDGRQSAAASALHPPEASPATRRTFGGSE